jgi:hypothetical protein
LGDSHRGRHRKDYFYGYFLDRQEQEVMKTRINIWVIFITAIIGLVGLAYAQTAKPGAMRTLTLENGEEVLDLSGEWDAVIENYGMSMKHTRGTFTNVLKITQEGSLFKAVRLEPEAKRGKGSMFMQGELDKSGFNTIYYIDVSGRLLPCTGQISEGGNEIKIDEGYIVRATLTRK